MKLINMIFIGLISLYSAHALSGISIVVSAKSPIETLSIDEVSDIFLGKSPTYPDGREAIPVELKTGSPVKDAFHNATTKKSPTQLKSYWAKMLFSGKGTPPKEVETDAAMKALVAENPNVIGYISSESVDASVKVISAF